MAKNYVEHDIEVKYFDGLIEKKEDWQWFIDIIEESYILEEFDSWNTYCGVSREYRQVYNYFSRIIAVSDVSCAFKKQEFKELWEIARYYNGKIDLKEVVNEVSLTTSRLFLLCIWITLLSNKCTNEENIYDVRILTYYNFFQLYRLDHFVEEKEDLVKYIEFLGNACAEIPIECLIDNIEMKEHCCSESFFEQHGEKLKNYNAFSYQSISFENPITWQEAYLLDMLRVSIQNRELKPLVVFRNTRSHDFSLWKEDVLINMERFFGNDAATFVIETISYILHGKELSLTSKLGHILLLSNAIEEESSFSDIFKSSSFEICAYLFQDYAMKDCVKDERYISLVRKIQQIFEPISVNKLRECGYPISKEQERVLNEYFASKFRRIEEINDANGLENYLNDYVVVQNIDDEHLKKTSEKFDSIITCTKVIHISAIFYSYMVFLIQVNEKGKAIDRLWLQKEMIRVQSIWETKYYQEQCEKMHVFSHEEQISHKELIKYGEMVLANPIMFAKDCTPSSEQELISMMSRASNYPLLLFTRHFSLSPIFPKLSGIVEVKRHEIDSILMDRVSAIIENKGYKFLNILKPAEFLASIHDCYGEYSQIAISMFTHTEELYNLVQAETDIELMPLSKQLCLGHVTQLFPVLEIKIRELASLFDFFPFKKNLKEFMQYNDPSTLIRDILKKINESFGDLSLVPDLLFVYNIMYNSNSLNVRNECVHGRDYLKGERLTFAFRAALIAIHIISFRIDTITEGVSDIR